MYGFMYSIFGLASLLGTFFVLYVQAEIEYIGMINVCLFFTLTAAILAYFYDFAKPLCYMDLLNKTKSADRVNREDLNRPLLLELQFD